MFWKTSLFNGLSKHYETTQRIEIGRSLESSPNSWEKTTYSSNVSAAPPATFLAKGNDLNHEPERYSFEQCSGSKVYR